MNILKVKGCDTYDSLLGTLCRGVCDILRCRGAFVLGSADGRARVYRGGADLRRRRGAIYKIKAGGL